MTHLEAVNKDRPEMRHEDVSEPRQELILGSRPTVLLYLSSIESLRKVTFHASFPQLDVSP